MHDTKFAGQGNCKINSKVRQEFILTVVKLFQQRQILFEIWSLVISILQGLEMICIPGMFLHNAYIVNGNLFHLCATAMDGNSQPLFALRCLDLIPIAPAMFVILNIIVKNKKVGVADLVKITTPGNVRWL